MRKVALVGALFVLLSLSSCSLFTGPAGKDGKDGLVPITSISISSAGSATSVLANGKLQFTAIVLPANATNQVLTWSVTDQSTSQAATNAVIDANGVLTDLNNGTEQVVVAAKAADGSAVASNQLLITAN